EKRNNLIKQRAAPNIDFDFGTRTVKPYRAEKISYRANERAEDISVTCRGRDKGQMVKGKKGDGTIEKALTCCCNETEEK
ncbi:12213_t:CDS:2, partial [Funneliformis geosporum]